MHMLDLHCHYLPGVDDGARTLNEGLALVRAAVANGIDRIVLTPHIHPGRYDNTATNLAVRFENFRRAVESAKIPAQLALASEARLCDELLPLLESGKVPLLESEIGAQTLLLEFPHSHVPAGCLAFVRWLQRRNIAPLLVHPERNKELMAHPQRLQKLREAGCMVQVTAAAIVGNFGARAQETVNLFLEKKWVDLVASDAHNLRHRPPLMREANAIIAHRYGEKTARELCEIRPYALTAGNFSRQAVKSPDKNTHRHVDAELRISTHYGASDDSEREHEQTPIPPSKAYDIESIPTLEPLLTAASTRSETTTSQREIFIENHEVFGAMRASTIVRNNIAAPQYEIPTAHHEALNVNQEMRSENIESTLLHGDLCDSAMDRMRSELLRRAAEPNSGGVKAARILQLMNALQAL